MLSISQKAQILAKAGLIQAERGTAQQGAAWEKSVEETYLAYSAARAARSLREAENARSAEMLRRMAWSSAAL